MSYLDTLGVHVNDIDKGFGLVDAACNEYGIEFDEFMDELVEDIADEEIGDSFSKTIVTLAFNKLIGLLKGHKVEAYVNGWDTSIAIDGKEIYC